MKSVAYPTIPPTLLSLLDVEVDTNVPLNTPEYLMLHKLQNPFYKKIKFHQNCLYSNILPAIAPIFLIPLISTFDGSSMLPRT